MPLATKSPYSGAILRIIRTGRGRLSEDNWADLPPGYILEYTGQEVPEGFVGCDGKAYWPWSYWKLFRVLGYTYGRKGLRFRVPDFRGAPPGGLSGLADV